MRRQCSIRRSRIRTSRSLAPSGRILTTSRLDGPCITTLMCAVRPFKGLHADLGYPQATNALIWSGERLPLTIFFISHFNFSGTAWSDGAANVLPEDRQVVSSFDVLDQLLLYFDDKRIYPNLHQVVVAGHSRGAQMACFFLISLYMYVNSTKGS